MQKEDSYILQTVDLSVPAETAFRFVRNDSVELVEAVENYVEKLTKTEDIEVFHKSGNCIVTNKGYHFADYYSYRKQS